MKQRLFIIILAIVFVFGFSLGGGLYGVETALIDVSPLTFTFPPVPSEGGVNADYTLNATNLMRIGSFGVSTSIEDNNDMDVISTEDGSYLAMLETRVRFAGPGLPCKYPFPPPDPLPPCKITERVLSLYDINTATDTYTLMWEKSHAEIGFFPMAVKFVEHDEEILVVVLGGSQLSFYSMVGQIVSITQLPETFVFPYELNAYLDFSVAYLGSEPFITVAGGIYDAHSQEPIDPRRGIIVGVAWDSATDNFVVTWTKIADDAPGIFTQIESAAAGDGTVTSVLIREQYVDENTIKDHLIVQRGITSTEIPGTTGGDQIGQTTRGLINWGQITLVGAFTRDRKFCLQWFTDHQSGETGEMILLPTNKLNLDGTSTAVLETFIAGKPQEPIIIAEGAKQIWMRVSQNGETGDKVYKTITVTYIKPDNTADGQGSVAVVALGPDPTSLEGGWRSFSWSGMTVDEIPGTTGGDQIGIAVEQRDENIPLRLLLFNSADGGAAFNVQELSSEPLGGPGTTDSAIIEFEICTAPIALANLIKIDNGDEDGDEDEGLFKVSFDYVDPYECHPVTCTAKLVGQDGKSVAVENGQLVEIDFDDDETEIEYEDGRLEIEGTVRLEVTCTNEIGLSSVNIFECHDGMLKAWNPNEAGFQAGD